MNIEEIQPVPVHVVKDATRRSPKPKRAAGIYRTVVLTASAPVRNLLATSPGRYSVLVQAISNDVVLAATEAQAQDAYNEVTGLPNPDGYLLAHANTAPTPLETTETLWCAAAAYPAIVTLAVFTPAGD
jgi:hypothetical protein